MRAERSPFVVIGGIATDVAHRVDRTAATQNATARPVQAPTVQLRFRLGVVIPIDARVTDELREARWHMDERIHIATTRLDQQDPQVAARAQTIGEHAAG